MTREQAAANREKILEVAGALFRERGFDGIGVADIMKRAGLTHGGFYGHFASKDDLAAEITSRVLGRSAWMERLTGTAKPFKQVVLTAPDVPRQNVEPLIAAASTRAERVTLYASSKDKALGLSKVKNDYERLGKVYGFPFVLPGMLVPLLAGMAARKIVRLVDNMHEAEQLLADEAAREDRRRLAREVHDVLQRL